jgi:hypothetical protein
MFFVTGNRGEDFQQLKRLAFAVYDLNCDDHVSDVDILAFDSAFIKGQ